MPLSATIRHGFPTVGKLLAPVRWLVGSRRRVGIVALVCLAMAAAPVAWWELQLVGLPDVGEPFDVAAFRAEAIPDEQNAYVLYRQAVLTYKPLTRGESAVSIRVGREARWEEVGEDVRGWVVGNRPALDLLRRGAERPDAFDPPDGTSRQIARVETLGLLHRLAHVEASRLELAGDMAGAWDWYRADLRLIRHVGLRSTADARQFAVGWQVDLDRRVKRWAADPRTTLTQMRDARDDAVAAGSMMPSDSASVRANYLSAALMPNGFDRLDELYVSPMARSIRYFYLPLTRDQALALDEAVRTWRREPERCRRLARLLVANRLAFLALPADRRPAPDPGVVTTSLYAFSPAAPAAARALTPDQLDIWLDTTPQRRMLIGMFDLSWLVAWETNTYRDLLVDLGTALYRRERGADPPTPEALVGPYLPSLPPAADTSSP